MLDFKHFDARLSAPEKESLASAAKILLQLGFFEYQVQANKQLLIDQWADDEEALAKRIRETQQSNRVLHTLQDEMKQISERYSNATSE